jgi:hypothetical protein
MSDAVYVTLVVKKDGLAGDPRAVLFEDEAARYAHTIVAWLQIPVIPMLRLAREDEDRADIVVGEGEDILDAIYRERQLLVDHRVVGAFRERVWPDRALSTKAFFALSIAVRGCIDRNLALSRLAAVLTPLDPDSVDPWDAVFAAHQEDAVSVRLSVSSLDREPGIWDAVAAQTVMNDIMRTTGFLCPLPVIDRSADLAPGEYRPHINDVPLPVRRWDAGHGQLIDFMNVILSNRPALLTFEGLSRKLDFLRETAPFLAAELEKRVSRNAFMRVAQDVLADPAVTLYEFDELVELLVASLAAPNLDPGFVSKIVTTNSSSAHLLDGIYRARAHAGV